LFNFYDGFLALRFDRANARLPSPAIGIPKGGITQDTLRSSTADLMQKPLKEQQIFKGFLIQARARSDLNSGG